MVIKGLKHMFSFPLCVVREVNFTGNSVRVYLEFDRRYRPRCSICDNFCSNDQQGFTGSARDIAFGPALDVEIIYPRRRVLCYHCNRREWQHPEGIDAHRRATHRLLQFALRMASDLSIRRTSEYLGISESAIRRWDKALLNEYLSEPNLKGLRVLLIDEKSIGKKHKYMTVVLNGETGELLHCLEGKKADSLKVFFQSLPQEVKDRIEVACIDRGGAYLSCLKEMLPNIKLVFDKYHLVSNLNDVVSKVRKDEWKNAKDNDDDEQATVIKNQRYNLLRRAENNNEQQQAKLDKLLDMNKNLNKAYLLLEDFREILQEKYLKYARPAIKQWLYDAENCGISRIAKFAKNLRKHTEGILNAIKYKVTNGLLEGFNNLIARVIHRGCGYRDFEYLKLKIRQISLPENNRVPHLILFPLK